MLKKMIIALIFCLLLININAETLQLAKTSESAILIEASTKEIIYEKNINERRYPASMTKMMTLLLTLEELEKGNIKLEDKVYISKNAASMGGTQIFVEEGTNVVLEDLIKGIAIASANDAAVAIAEKIGGTEENFVNLMNSKAKSLGLKNTSFKNPHGLDTEGHYSSAYDMAIIASELVKHEDILKITSTYEEYVKVGKEKHWLVNTNTLVRFYEGVDGLKTGYTDKAKYCLTATKENNGMRLISVVMGSPSKEERTTDTVNMMEYGFAMYNTKNILNTKKKIGKIYVNNAVDRNAEYKLKDNVNILVKKGTENVKYKVSKELYDLSAPIKKGETVGKLVLNYGNKEYEYDLISSRDVKKANYIRTIYNNFKDIISGKVNLLNL